jgi:hypothetical protein
MPKRTISFSFAGAQARMELLQARCQTSDLRDHSVPLVTTVLRVDTISSAFPPLDIVGGLTKCICME